MKALEELWEGPDVRPFALLYRPESPLHRPESPLHRPDSQLHRPGSRTRATPVLDVLTGDIEELENLAQLPRPLGGPGPGAQSAQGPRPGARHRVLAVLPYRQIRERGFEYPEDHAPLLAMTVRDQWTVPLDQALTRLPADPIELTDADFDIDDDAYADVVRRLVSDEIGRGEGANFVIKRSFTARVTDYSPRLACALLRRLLLHEEGTYWTFLVHTGQRTFVGASPERHITLRDDTAVMNPISGTYRFPEDGPSLAGTLGFLSDGKESDELYMVVDEELKMMASVCETGGRVLGPRLKEMARLAHTEYHIRGRSTLPVHEVLRRTLFAPTVTGSPLESACRAIARYEPEGRGYYSGALALIGTDALGRPELDSAILIRTAQIDEGGELSLGVGATVVRHSDPVAEAAETRAKAAGLLRALEAPADQRNTPSSPARGALAGHPAVREALAARNQGLADFWVDGRHHDRHDGPRLDERHRVLVIDAEDTFTAMLAHQIRALGAQVTVRRHDEPFDPAAYDVVLAGPGPGDPRQLGHPKIAALHATLGKVLAGHHPLLAVCLGHQVLSGLLGLPLVRREHPNQGVRREIDLFGDRVRVGFYNTFAARSDADHLYSPALGGRVDICRDRLDDEVHALRAPRLRSFQFHPESVLSPDGLGVLAGALEELLPVPDSLPRPTLSVPYALK